MKRRLIIAAIFLLAGAVVNVAVAWGIALSVNPYHAPIKNESPMEVHWTVFGLDERRDFGTVSYQCSPGTWEKVYRGEIAGKPPPRGEYPAIDDALPQWASRHQVFANGLSQIVGRGWPFLSLSTSFYPIPGPPQYDESDEVSWGFEAPLRPFTPKRPGFPPALLSNYIWPDVWPRLVPLRPIWPGFAVNTILYAAILWLLIPGSFVLRRLIRVKRGLAWGCAWLQERQAATFRFGQWDGRTRAQGVGWEVLWEGMAKESVTDFSYGWPSLAMSSKETARSWPRETAEHWRWRPFDRPLSFPLRPIWPGFAIDTLFYAVVLWLLICGPFALRRLIRIRRGLCPKCAYPMGESGVCRECGKALPERAKVAT